MHFTIHRLKKRVYAAIGQTADWALFLGIVLIGGLGSSWYMVEAGSNLTTVTVGPWTAWTSAAQTDADPYTRAHYIRRGILPLSAEFARSYVATTDSEGRNLHSSCNYEIEGKSIDGYWWSITVFDSRGRVIRNVLDRYTYTSHTIALSPNGTYTASLSRDAQRGNWLPTGGAGKLAVALTVLDLGTRSVALEGGVERRLPSILRTSC
jgi:hypothetical protein